ncbi:MAG: inositol monophosphatase [Proteobacteria bacterium]|nr:inositol monophosphatase [Pseudomonadota bacterium]
MGFATEVIRRSGEQALSFYGKGNPEMKFDEAVVTEAELQLREFFQAELYAHYPEHQVYGKTQANEGYTHEGNRYLWIYDALDGVANFQAGIPIWGMSLALLENFWPLLGLFYMPVTGDLFHARAGQKAFRGDKEVRVSRQETISDESLLLTYSRFHHKFHTTFPGKIRDLGCTTAHVCYVAMGRAEAALLVNESFQDLAGVGIVLEAAGGGFFKMDGSEFFLNEYLDGQRIDEPLLVVAPDKYSEVRECLKGAH